ncbi:MAG: aminoglycoside 3'-phosphotransferase [Acidimicrobiia bacterium]|nr:aminoglycoside 3'-phosphotransferase [Acidimicrobiia bacterium]
MAELHVGDLPPDLHAVLGEGELVPVTVGRSGSVVARVVRDGAADLFVKLVERGGSSPSIRHEIERLEWLAGSIAVPELVAHGADDHVEWMVITALDGSDLTSRELGGDPERVVRLFAEALRTFHDSLDVESCPFDGRTDALVAIAADRVEAGLVAAGDFEPIHRGVTAEELLGHVRSRQPDDPPDLVVAHGDYCIPNVFAAEGAVSGYVDLGLVGVGDRYRDLGIGARSIAHNLGGEAVGLFFDAYGIEWPDLARVDFFVMLDELF